MVSMDAFQAFDGVDNLQRPVSLIRKQKEAEGHSVTSSPTSSQRKKTFDNTAALESIEKLVFSEQKNGQSNPDEICAASPRETFYEK
uniref:Uncharacterized protein n=2 Tax=Caenorhabditis japonica TaxID=281687 RepID=A0A8R1INC3_CAEJA